MLQTSALLRPLQRVMPNIILPPAWQGRECDCTPQSVYQNRRAFLRQMGLGAAGMTISAGALGCANGSRERASATPPDGPLDTIPANAPRQGYPAPRNETYTAERALTDRLDASSYNNFYEFKNSGELKECWPLTGAYEPFPMELQIAGLVEKPMTLDVGELITSMELEERIYRFRCVEAWAMTVPWTGFPLRKLIERAAPTSQATHVRFVCANRPKEMPGLRATLNSGYYNWPYYEGLRMDEAMNDLAFVVTGLYGEPLPKQNGAPLRMALPWKYGYKGPKAFVRLEFVDKQPPTFWNDLEASEYGFLSNVNPNVPHPRWSQAQETLLAEGGRNGEKIPTHIFNGYGAFVADLYPDEPRQPTGPMAR